jgi:hypothetical protein
MQLKGLVDGVQLLHRGNESRNTNPSYDADVMRGHAVGFDAANFLSNLDSSTCSEVVMYVRRTTTAIFIKSNADRVPLTIEWALLSSLESLRRT